MTMLERLPGLADRDLLADDTIAMLQETYGVGDWLEWRRTPKGSSNTSYFITTTTGRYVLRRSNTRKTLEAIQFEVRLLDYLRSSGYPAPRW